MMKKFLISILIIILLVSISQQEFPVVEAQKQDSLYVANTKALCGNHSNCFYNDDADLAESNGLTKAIAFARENNLSGVTITVLPPYQINSHSIQVDFPVTIAGKDSGWITTSASDCTRPMFLISSEVTMRNISLNDGACQTLSRDLVVVNSNFPVLIEHSTLENGQTAVSFIGGAGNLTLQFNQIKNNQFAINRTNTDQNAILQVTANNIVSNGNPVQASCTGKSFVDHNFWGNGTLPSEAAPDCGADDARRLDAPIVNEGTGVAGRLMRLTSSFPAEDFYGFRASSPDPVNLYVVNHGGSMPFADDAGNLYACSNFFDVFLPPSASATELTLSFAYRDSNDCAPVIESAAYCGSGKQNNFPLLWYDPKTRVTDKWDKTGDQPQSSVGNIYRGQETVCRTGSKTIDVVIDNYGRPDLLNDLLFTPFVIGFEQGGILSFTASPASNRIDITWTTVTEVNTLGFQLSRSTSSDGTYELIANDIPAKGSETTGKSYSFSDSNVVAGQNYFYKLIIKSSDGSIQQILGPINALIPLPSTATNPYPIPGNGTRTPTRTITPFLTATSIYKTDTDTDATLFLPTATETPVFEESPDPDLTPEATPTPSLIPSQTATPTISGTPLSGLLGKSDRYSGRSRVPFILGGVAVLSLFLLLGLYIHRKHH